MFTGYRTYLASIIGLIVVPLTNYLTGFDAGSKLATLIVNHCPSDLAGCTDAVAKTSAAIQQIYLAIVSLVIVYFRSKVNAVNIIVSK